MGLTPERLAMLDQARAESRDDLAKLLTAFTNLRRELGEAEAVGEIVQGLLDQPCWGRLNLSTVLGEALAQMTGEVRDGQ